MSVDVQVARSPDAVPAAAWEALAAGRTPAQLPGWYRRMPPPGEPRLLVARVDGCVAGVLPLFLVRRPGAYFHTPREVFCGARERALLAAAGEDVGVLDAAAAAEWLPAAVSVSPFGYRGGLVHPAGPGARAVADAVAAAADALCRAEGVRVALHHFLEAERDGPWMDALTGAGGWVGVAGAGCDLDVEGEDLDGWFAALGGRGRRLRSQWNRAQRDAGVRWRAWEMDGPAPAGVPVEEAGRLFAAAARRHEPLAPDAAAWTRLAAEWEGRRVLLAAARPDGTLRAALLAFEKDGVLHPKCFGAEGRDDYFVLTFPALVQAALRRGVRRIEYGGGAHRAKLLRGARLRWLLAGVRAYDPALRARLRAFLPAYARGKEAYFRALAADARPSRAALAYPAAANP